MLSRLPKAAPTNSVARSTYYKMAPGIIDSKPYKTVFPGHLQPERPT
jgi:hypothetical protein